MEIEIVILNKDFYSQGCKCTSLHKGELGLPSYATKGSAAMDIISTKDYTIYPGDTVNIPTGLAIWIGSEQTSYGLSKYSHQGYGGEIEFCQVAGLIVPRSGLGRKGLVLGNTVGVIDQDYQGELIVNAWNRLESNIEEDYSNSFADEFGVFGVKEYETNTIEIKQGQRFAQLLFLPIIKPTFNIVEDFSINTQRGALGFGSTGE